MLGQMANTVLRFESGFNNFFWGGFCLFKSLHRGGLKTMPFDGLPDALAGRVPQKNVQKIFGSYFWTMATFVRNKEH